MRPRTKWCRFVLFIYNNTQYDVVLEEKKLKSIISKTTPYPKVEKLIHDFACIGSIRV